MNALRMSMWGAGLAYLLHVVDPHPFAAMPLNEDMSRALRELAQLAAKEQDPQNLHQLVLRVNGLLDVIERRLAELKPDSNPSSN